jgi:mannan endo-1,4-beta-mannosidase
MAEALMAGVTVDLADLRIREPWALPDNETAEYVPCQLNPDIAPDAVIVIPPTGEVAYKVDILLCSLGYDQSVRVYDNTGALLAATDDKCGRVDTLRNFTVQPWTRYSIVIDGVPGEPYGSTRGGCGVKITRPDGRPSMHGLHAVAAPQDAARFVRAVNGTFYLGCDPFVYVGTNSFDLMDTARYPNLRYLVDRRLDEMKSRGLTVGRTWGFSLGTGESLLQRQQALQLKPGVYDEQVFQGLDYALVQARKRGIKLILTLEDYWLSAGRYIDWSPTAGAKTDFFTDYGVRSLYRAHLRYFTSRVNTFTGQHYKDDPTIMAWNLVNEPRCTGCGWALQDWVDEMSMYMRALDPNHMITIGEEGFYSSTCERVYLNPGAGKRRTGIASSPWALQEGQDMLENHRSRDISFATTHVWPDNWLGFADFSPVNSNQAFDYANGTEVWREKLDYLMHWIQAHIDDGVRLNKPIIIEEFGKIIPSSYVYSSGLLQPGEWVQGDLRVRNRFFQAVYDLMEASALKGGPVAGSNFWVLYRNDGQGSVDPYRVTVNDNSTFTVIANHKWNMRRVRPSRPRVCPAGAAQYTPSTAALTVDDDAGFLDTVAVNVTVRAPPATVPKPAGYAADPSGMPSKATMDAAAQRQQVRLTAYTMRLAPAGNIDSSAASATTASTPLTQPLQMPPPDDSSSSSADDAAVLGTGRDATSVQVVAQSAHEAVAAASVAAPASEMRTVRTLELTSLLGTVNAAMADAAARDGRKAAIMPAPVPGGNIPLPWWAQATRAASAAGMRQRVDNNGD